MFFALLFCTVLSLSAAPVFATASPGKKESSTKEFAVPDLPPYGAALDAIHKNKPGLALAHYADIRKDNQRREVLQALLTKLQPGDYNDIELMQLVDALETWNGRNLSRKIEAPSTKWKKALTLESPLLKQQYEPAKVTFPMTDKPPTKIMGTPVPTDKVRLYSSDNHSFDLLQIYALNPGISEWLANVFKNASRTSIKVPNIQGSVLEPILITLNYIGDLWVWAVDNFPTKIAREAQMIKIINEHLEKHATLKTSVDSNIFEIIKAADALEAPLARKLFVQRLTTLNMPATVIKQGLEGYSHLWPEWVKKGK